MILRLIVCLCLLTLAPLSATAAPLDELLQQVRTQLQQDKRLADARIERFKERRDERAKLLAQARAELDAQRLRRTELQASLEQQQTRLEQLRPQLQQRIGNLREVFGLVRQSARESAESLAASMDAARLPQAVQLLRELSNSQQLPDIAQLEGLWLALLDAMAASAKVERFEAAVISPQGVETLQPVTRIGPFTAISEGRFLRWLPESERFMDLARQPPARLRRQAAALEAGGPAWVDAPVDPSRGVLMSVLVQAPSLQERIEQGGPIGYVILALGALGLLVVLERALLLAWTGGKVRRQIKRTDQPSENNPLGRILGAVQDWRHLPPEALQHKLDEAVLRELPKVRRGLSLVGVLAAVAPLLGLLGTVAGMIETFQSITLFGTGDPKLMSGGISEALVTTELGLIVAIPLVLCHGVLSGQSKRLVQTLDQQSAALVARRVESDAIGVA